MVGDAKRATLSGWRGGRNPASGDEMQKSGHRRFCATVRERGLSSLLASELPVKSGERGQYGAKRESYAIIHKYRVDTTMTKDSIKAASGDLPEAGAPEVTQQMMEAGSQALREAHLALIEPALDEYPLIARTVFEAMAAFSPERERKNS